MSFRFLAWAQSAKTGSSSTKSVLMALCSIVNDDGIGFPSQQRIADDSELSIRTVKRAMDDLEKAGVISRERRYREGGYRTSDLIYVHQEPQILGAKLSRDTESGDTVSNLRCHHGIAEPVIEPVSTNTIRAREKSQNKPMPEDFYPNLSVQLIAQDLGYSKSNIDVEVQIMRDWSINAGPKGRKKDWQAFARNWFRKNGKQRKPNGTNQGNYKLGTVADGFAKVRAVIAEAERRENEGNGTVGEENDVGIPRLRQSST